VLDRAQLIDQEVAARLLSCGRTTLYRLRRSGQLTSVGRGRYGRALFDRSEVERLAREGWLIPDHGWDGNNAPDPYGRLTLDPLPR
jgi:hypothetical protein